MSGLKIYFQITKKKMVWIGSKFSRDVFQYIRRKQDWNDTTNDLLGVKMSVNLETIL